MATSIECDQIVAQRIAEHAKLISRVQEDEEYLLAVTRVAGVISEALVLGKKILFFGNGGSAADSQHLTAELTGRYLKERPPLAAIALSTNTSALTAIGNDYAFEEVFARQVEAIGNKGDVAFGISTTGNSANVIKAVQAATAKGLLTVGLTGSSGGAMKSLVQYCICIPSDETPRIQEAHIMTGHIICELVENRFCEGHLS